jgi:hypothetical protein
LSNAATWSKAGDTERSQCRQEREKEEKAEDAKEKEEEREEMIVNKNAKELPKGEGMRQEKEMTKKMTDKSRMAAEDVRRKNYKVRKPKQEESTTSSSSSFVDPVSGPCRKKETSSLPEKRLAESKPEYDGIKNRGRNGTGNGNRKLSYGKDRAGGNEAEKRRDERENEEVDHEETVPEHGEAEIKGKSRAAKKKNKDAVKENNDSERSKFAKNWSTKNMYYKSSPAPDSRAEGSDRKVTEQVGCEIEADYKDSEDSASAGVV